jgi:hypothetical protein
MGHPNSVLGQENAEENRLGHLPGTETALLRLIVKSFFDDAGESKQIN